MIKRLQINKSINTALQAGLYALLFSFISLNGNSQSAMHFDGEDDFISTSNTLVLGLAHERTVEAWIQTTDSGAQSIVGWGILQTGRRFDIRLDDSYLRLELENGFIRGLNTVLNDGEWHHIAVVVPEGGTTLMDVLMYIDGELETHTEHTRELETVTTSITIGANALIPDRFFNGSIDELRIWNIARTQEEISYYMTNDLCDETGLMRRYSFDEGEPNGDNSDLTASDLITGSEVTLENFALTGSTSNWVEGIDFIGVTGTDVQTSCGPYTWIDGVTYDTSNNTAVYVFEGGATNMCDSVVTLDLTVVNADVTVDDPSIMADFEGGSYQWLDCDNAFAEIPNETEQTFVATENGNYAVEVSYEGCVMTSECVSIIASSVEEEGIFKSTSIYPNPSHGQVNIKLGALDMVDISIIDITGQSVFEAKEIRAKNYQFVLDVPAGMYLVEMVSNDQYNITRLVIQK